ncbi:MAG TPA: 4Fe-4S dicluster domain-containing protein [Peptococcaceae bacterium]|nr:4Fe-4S dicluster domain-containing protein [Peptococcaceae bacterium]
MIKLYDAEKDCCGCTACMSICPRNAITMVENERGFEVPIIDTTKCNECGWCQKVCDFKIFRPTSIEPATYAFINKEGRERETSQSGGVAAALVSEILSQNGVVFGSELINGYEVKHNMEKDAEGCLKFKGSKYVQSSIGNCFTMCKNQLNNGNIVLFTGTGCQIHGLLKFLEITNTPIDNLYTMDIVCHGTPSYGIWKKYIKMYDKMGIEIKNVIFRDKSFNGWRESIEKYETADGETFYSRAWANIYYRRIMFRDSCYNCKYTTPNRKSDITVGDYWGIEKIHPELDDNKGVSLVLVHTKKGQELFDQIKKKAVVVCTPLQSALQPQLVHPIKKGIEYNYFWKKYNSNPDKAIKQFFFPSFTTKVVYPLIKKIKFTIRKAKKFAKSH